MVDKSPKFGVPFSAILKAMDRNLTGELRETTPSFQEAVGDLQGAYARYGGRKPFARATGLKEATLRRWEKQVAEGKTPKISEDNKARLTGAVKRVERVMRLSSAHEQRLRDNPLITLRATFSGQTERGERTLRLDKTTKDRAGFKSAANKLVGSYIAGSKRGMMDAFDDMITAYEPDLAESYFSVEALGGLSVS